MSAGMIFDAVAEARPGPKWRGRWQRSWPAYEAWFRARGGDDGPSRSACEAALARYMPELVPVHADLARLAGDGDRAARFLSQWCPPRYLGGCTVAARADGDEVRLVRNYDLSPELNEGLLLSSAWRRPVMGMVEFLWGLSDGINDAGLSVALAYGGRGEVGRGFGITLILRYLLETCETVSEALAALDRIPSHMAYNLVLADAQGATAAVELKPGGGVTRRGVAAVTNHQSGPARAERPEFTRTHQRLARAEALVGGPSDAVAPGDLAAAFLSAPLRQDRYGAGFGTLFTAAYDPVRRRMALHWPDARWEQSFDAFAEGRREVDFETGMAPEVEVETGLETGPDTGSDWVWDGPGAGASVQEWIAYGLSMAGRRWHGAGCH